MRIVPQTGFIVRTVSGPQALNQTDCTKRLERFVFLRCMASVTPAARKPQTLKVPIAAQLQRGSQQRTHLCTPGEGSCTAFKPNARHARIARHRFTEAPSHRLDQQRIKIALFASKLGALVETPHWNHERTNLRRLPDSW